MTPRTYYIVECWCGGGAMIWAEDRLWNGYNKKPGTLFTDRKAARKAINATRKVRKKQHQPSENYYIQRLVTQ